ncbi:MAG TPA: hypothetical protein VMY98_02020 [Anaerolineae bacterium]|nr:hypothetical protein [Anaerolineae bacterium]
MSRKRCAVVALARIRLAMQPQSLRRFYWLLRETAETIRGAMVGLGGGR